VKEVLEDCNHNYYQINRMVPYFSGTMLEKAYKYQASSQFLRDLSKQDIAVSIGNIYPRTKINSVSATKLREKKIAIKKPDEVNAKKSNVRNFKTPNKKCTLTDNGSTPPTVPGTNSSSKKHYSNIKRNIPVAKEFEERSFNKNKAPLKITKKKKNQNNKLSPEKQPETSSSIHDISEE